MSDGTSPPGLPERPLEGLGRRESVLQRRLSLGDMLDPPSFNEVVKGFVDLYKVGIKVFDERGNKLAEVKVGSGDSAGTCSPSPRAGRAAPPPSRG